MTEQRSEEIGQQAARIILEPERRVWLRRIMLVVATLVLSFNAWAIWQIRWVDQHRIADLEADIEEQHGVIEFQEAVIQEAAAYIAALAVEAVAHGADPGLLQLDGIPGGPVDDPPGDEPPPDS